MLCVEGGGERYLFSIIKSLQDHGHRVDLITDDYNIGKTKEEVLRVAHALRVDLSAANLAYIMVKDFRSSLQTLPWKYKVFFALGNTKVGACILCNAAAATHKATGGMVRLSCHQVRLTLMLMLWW